MTVTEVLQLLPKEVIMSFDIERDTADLLDVMKKQQIIQNHPYKISECQKHGETYYLTYVHDETKKNHRRQITAKSLSDIENKIYEAHKQAHLLTVEKVAEEWLKSYTNKVKPTAFSRIMSDHKRFILNSSFSQKTISKIKDTDIEDFIEKTIIEKQLRKRALENLKTLLRHIFKYARKHGYISINPMETVEISTVHLYTPPKPVKEAVVFTNKERDLLRDYIKRDSANFKTSAPYAVLLSFQLGLRVGELIALKWSDIHNGKIHIQRQEIVYDKYDENLNKVASSVHEIVEYTKTQAGERKLFLTPEAKRILDSIKFWNKSHKIQSEFIFADKYGKNFNRQRINTCLYNYCVAVDIIKKSSHKIRRSVVSNMLDNIVNQVSVKDFAGHEELETTLNSYYKDVSEEEDVYNGMCACL